MTEPRIHTTSIEQVRAIMLAEEEIAREESVPLVVRVFSRAFADSSCCGKALWRVCRPGEPDLFVCRACGGLCDPVATA